MRFKNHLFMTDLWVELDAPDGNKIRIPSEGVANSMAQLITLVDIEIKSLNQQGYDYIMPLQMQADKAKLSYRAYLNVVIENIVCMRHPDPASVCYSDGLGDNLHLVSGRIDNLINKMPSRLNRAAKRAVQIATKATTGTASKTLGGCQTCGGRRSISPTQSNLGRAGALNKYQ